MYLIKIKNGDNETTLPKEQRISPRVTKSKNKSDSFNFEVTNEFDKSLLKPFTTIVTVLDEESKLFRGRIVGNESDIYNFGIVECEGALSFLKDTFYPPFEWSNSPETLLQSVLDNHNANVEDAKKIYLGTVTVSDPNDYLAVSSEEYNTSLSIIQDKLIEKLGGYLVVRYEDDGTYIDWLTDILRENSQKIELGSNLIDVNVQKNYTGIITRLIPLGAKDEETGKRLDISSVNNGLTYIDNQEGIAKYGIISGTVYWDDVTVPDNLLSKANAIVDELAKGKCTITINAVDLNMVDKTYEKFELGDWIKTIIPTHGINEFYQLNQIEYHIDEPEDNVITLGDILKTSTSETSSNIKDINDVMNSIINPSNNTLMAKQIAGVLNLMNTSMRAQKNNSQKQDVRAILFEDLDKESPTFGAMCLGTQGIQIAKQRNELDTDWVWGTAIDFQTIYANYIITGILTDKLGNFYLDMDTGELSMKNGVFTGRIEGSQFIVTRERIVNVYEGEPDAIKNHIMGTSTLTAEQLARLDINQDGKITASDMLFAQKILLGQISNKFTDTITIYNDGTSKITLKTSNGTQTFETVISTGGVDTKNIYADNADIDLLKINSWIEMGENVSIGISHETIGDGETEREVFDISVYNELPCFINGVPIKDPTVLASPGWYMNESQTVTLSEAITDQMNGVVLVWSAYEDGQSVNRSWFSHFISKHWIYRHEGQGISTGLMVDNEGTYAGAKYVYVSDKSIKGHAYNSADAFTGANSIKYTNKHWVLRYVIGV